MTMSRALALSAACFWAALPGRLSVLFIRLAWSGAAETLPAVRERSSDAAAAMVISFLTEASIELGKHAHGRDGHARAVMGTGRSAILLVAYAPSLLREPRERGPGSAPAASCLLPADDRKWSRHLRAGSRRRIAVPALCGGEYSPSRSG